MYRGGDWVLPCLPHSLPTSISESRPLRHDLPTWPLPHSLSQSPSSRGKAPGKKRARGQRASKHHPVDLHRDPQGGVDLADRRGPLYVANLHAEKQDRIQTPNRRARRTNNHEISLQLDTSDPEARWASELPAVRALSAKRSSALPPWRWGSLQLKNYFQCCQLRLLLFFNSSCLEFKVESLEPRAWMVPSSRPGPVTVS